LHIVWSGVVEFGVATVLSDEGVDPRKLAVEVEAAGFESIFLADHSHIPVSRESPYPHPPFGELPRQYYRTLEPLTALAAMAEVTSNLRLGTGVCLVVERDPIHLAKQAATVDHLSGGRLVLGVGAGWNREEMRNHGTDPRQRMGVLTERLEAIRRIWTQEQAEYHGKFVDFDPIFSWPKPVQSPHPPVLIGGNGPTVLDRVLAVGDGWMPGHQRDLNELGERIATLRSRGEAVGRHDLNVTIFGGAPEYMTAYEEIGADRVVFLVWTHDETQFQADLAKVVEACL
jgi:probable F420-dependent oxidoreductase